MPLPYNSYREFTVRPYRFTVWFKSGEPDLISVTDRQANVWSFEGQTSTTQLKERFPLLAGYLESRMRTDSSMGR